MAESKARTSITIDPELWAKAKDYCKTQTRPNGNNLCFSDLVALALTKLLDEQVSQ